MTNINTNTATTGTGRTTPPPASGASSTATGGATGTQAMGSLKSLNATFEMFLKLLTTQMKNQDPLKPQDPNEMTNQLVSFANVEQNIGTNSRLDKLLAAQQTNRAASTLGYIGHDVEVESDRLVRNGDAPNTFSYSLPRAAQTLKVEVLDANGARVRTLTGGATGAGLHSLTWDGKNDYGTAQPDGVYRLNISAVDADKQPMTVTTRITGRVTGVDMSGDETMLNIGPLAVNMDNLYAVH